MKHFEAEFIAAVDKKDSFPLYNLPEIAVAGRSNVGKSSLLNSILLRKNLAHISSHPGKTQCVNLYNVDGKWVFADMPGFGYAAVSKDKRKDWQELTYNYLSMREQLRFVVVLIDSRHDPSDIDLGFIEWLENHKRSYLIVLTKCDKISSLEISERKEQIETVVSSCKFCYEVLPYSTVTSLGRQQLIAIISRECK